MQSALISDLKINPKFVEIIPQKIDAGLYDDADDVIESALNLLDQEERQLEWLRAELQIGIDQLDRGESVLVDDLDEFFDMIKLRAAERNAAGIPIKDAVKP